MLGLNLKHASKGALAPSKLAYEGVNTEANKVTPCQKLTAQHQLISCDQHSGHSLKCDEVYHCSQCMICIEIKQNHLWGDKVRPITSAMAFSGQINDIGEINVNTLSDNCGNE